ncbi:MAG: 5-oxoprolinase subunit PxpA [Candidatus Baltobacteraceae bacterium]
MTFLPVRRIDLNADLGEGCGDDEAILGIVTSANVACGGHAGDERSMRDTVRAARRCGVSVGAHPSYPDREGFGRRPMDMRGESIAACVGEQIALLAQIAREEGVMLTHVKPHGALYNRSAVDDAVADAVAEAVVAVDATLALVGLAGSHSLERARSRGLRTVGELFADRRYREDGTLVPRGEPDAIVENPEEAAAQALDLARSDRGESICLHGDTPHALLHARCIRERLESAGFILRSAAALDD